MPEIIKEAKTVESAIAEGIKALGCTQEDADIEILQEPAKGIFGIAKMAKVKVSCTQSQNSNESAEVGNSSEPRENPGNQESPEVAPGDISQGKDTLKQILSLMGIPAAKIKSHEEESTIYLDIHSEAEGLLIGRHGQTLAALQYLLNRVMNHHFDKMTRYVVDVGGYRVRHKIILEKMAKRIASKVAESKEEEQLQAMSAFDRRIIHMCVKDNSDVTTYSLGEGSFRRVVIAPKGAPQKTDEANSEKNESEDQSAEENAT